ncbi:MAG: ATP-binding protein [Thermodesulfovibrionales bacterium]|nr:ATP-binding protein [Thermodesulfovibrionales bacterium]
MEDLSLHILDIVENSIAAGANRVEIRVIEDTRKDILSVEIRDNGKGMSEEVLENAVDPFYTTRTTRRVGLGLSLLSQSAKEAEGEMTIKSKEDEGTTIYAYFKHSHIDRKPIGNMAETLIVLIAGNPDIDFLYEHRLNNRAYSINTKDIREELGDVPLSSPGVIEVIRKDIRNGLKILSS